MYFLFNRTLQVFVTYLTYPGTEGTKENRHWNHNGWRYNQFVMNWSIVLKFVEHDHQQPKGASWEVSSDLQPLLDVVLILVITQRWQNNLCCPPYISELRIYICMICGPYRVHVLSRIQERVWILKVMWEETKKTRIHYCVYYNW